MGRFELRSLEKLKNLSENDIFDLGLESGVIHACVMGKRVFYRFFLVSDINDRNRSFSPVENEHAWNQLQHTCPAALAVDDA